MLTTAFDYVKSHSTSVSLMLASVLLQTLCGKAIDMVR